MLGGAVVAAAFITAGEMLYKPTATAHVADAAPEGMVGRFSSLYAAASISGMFLAPALGGTSTSTPRTCSTQQPQYWP